MLFALLVEYGPTPPTEELLQEHRDWLYPRFSEGDLILSGGLEAVDGHPPSAVAFFEADSLDAAKKLMVTEPFYRTGACTHRVVPFTPRVRVVGMDDRFGVEVRAIPVDWNRQEGRSAVGVTGHEWLAAPGPRRRPLVVRRARRHRPGQGSLVLGRGARTQAPLSSRIRTCR